jgi:hypothetical protein
MSNFFKNYVNKNSQKDTDTEEDTEDCEENVELENYELEQCRTCMRQFVVDPKFARKDCIVCFKKEKKYKLSHSDKQIVRLQKAIEDEKTGVVLNRGGLSKTAHQLMECEKKLTVQNKEIKELHAQIEQLKEEKKHLRHEIGKFRLGQNIIVGGKWSFSSKRIKSILKFVHPDKVDTSDKPIARGITSWLLDYLSHVKELENKLESKKKITSRYPDWHSKHNTDI